MRAENSDPVTLSAAMDEWYRSRLSSRGTVATIADHIDHIVAVAGVDHVGIGSDFDGVPMLPEGMEDVSKLPALTAELVDRGYSAADVVKILGENVLRVLEEVERG